MCQLPAELSTEVLVWVSSAVECANRNGLKRLKALQGSSTCTPFSPQVGCKLGLMSSGRSCKGLGLERTIMGSHFSLGVDEGCMLSHECCLVVLGCWVPPTRTALGKQCRSYLELKGAQKQEGDRLF